MDSKPGFDNTLTPGGNGVYDGLTDDDTGVEDITGDGVDAIELLSASVDEDVGVAELLTATEEAVVELLVASEDKGVGEGVELLEATLTAEVDVVIDEEVVDVVAEEEGTTCAIAWMRQHRFTKLGHSGRLPSTLLLRFAPLFLSFR